MQFEISVRKDIDKPVNNIPTAILKKSYSISTNDIPPKKIFSETNTSEGINK